MRTTSLDILERSKLPDQQARAILKVMELELEAHSGALATHADLSALRTELRADITALRIEIGQAKLEMVRWLIGTNVIFLGLGLGVVYFFLNHIHH